MADEMTLDELKQVTIDYYVNLQRIKKANTDNNREYRKDFVEDSINV